MLPIADDEYSRLLIRAFGIKAGQFRFRINLDTCEVLQYAPQRRSERLAFMDSPLGQSPAAACSVTHHKGSPCLVNDAGFNGKAQTTRHAPIALEDAGSERTQQKYIFPQQRISPVGPKAYASCHNVLD